MVLITFSATSEFNERFHRYIKDGQRSHFIVMSVNKELDKLDVKTVVKTEQEAWLETVVVPLLSTYLQDRSNYQILELYDDDRLVPIIKIISEIVGTTISNSHMRFCLTKVRNDRQQTG